jgi:N-acetyl-gamma-glutamyl-phosphate reductase
MAAKVFIDGEAGTTGLQIHRRLADRGDIELLRIDDARRKDPEARREALHAAEVAILCLPDEAAREAVSMLGNAATRVIDASTAYRVDPDWAYGFPEMTEGQSDRVANARLVSNPGCYPTGAIGLIRPLREAGLLPEDYPVSVNAVSGYSGGGKAMIAEFERPDAPAGFVYGLAQTHKHLPEMALHGLLPEAPIFAPSVGKFAQGMIVQVPLHLDRLNDRPALADLHEVLVQHYRRAHNVTVAPFQPDLARLDPQALNGTDRMELHVFGHPGRGRAVLAAVLDNLGKGASGAAVQNLELMLGLG